MGPRPSNLFFAIFLVLMGMIVTAIGAGWHFWPEVAVGLVAFVVGLVWMTYEMLR